MLVRGVDQSGGWIKTCFAPTSGSADNDVRAKIPTVSAVFASVLDFLGTDVHLKVVAANLPTIISPLMRFAVRIVACIFENIERSVPIKSSVIHPNNCTMLTIFRFHLNISRQVAGLSNCSLKARLRPRLESLDGSLTWSKLNAVFWPIWSLVLCTRKWRRWKRWKWLL